MHGIPMFHGITGVHGVSLVHDSVEMGGVDVFDIVCGVRCYVDNCMRDCIAHYTLCYTFNCTRCCTLFCSLC